MIMTVSPLLPARSFFPSELNSICQEVGRTLRCVCRLRPAHSLYAQFCLTCGTVVCSHCPEPHSPVCTQPQLQAGVVVPYISVAELHKQTLETFPSPLDDICPASLKLAELAELFKETQSPGFEVPASRPSQVQSPAPQELGGPAYGLSSSTESLGNGLESPSLVFSTACLPPGSPDGAISPHPATHNFDLPYGLGVSREPLPSPLPPASLPYGFELADADPPSPYGSHGSEPPDSQRLGFGLEPQHPNGYGLFNPDQQPSFSQLSTDSAISRLSPARPNDLSQHERLLAAGSGCYTLRPSSTVSGALTLVYNRTGKIKKALLSPSDAGWTVAGVKGSYQTPASLISHLHGLGILEMELPE